MWEPDIPHSSIAANSACLVGCSEDNWDAIWSAFLVPSLLKNISYIFLYYDYWQIVSGAGGNFTGLLREMVLHRNLEKPLLQMLW